MCALERKVFYLNVTAFSIAIERVLDPSLKNRPVVMAPVKSERSLLWEVSPEAKNEGLEKGMSLAQAKKVCKDIIVLPPRPDLVNQVNRKIEDKLLSNLTPVYEVEKPGHAYLDLTGFEKLYGEKGDMGKRILRDLKNDFSLIPSVGSSVNKLVSKVAAKSKTDDIVLIQEGKEKQFLSPLPVEVLPLVRQIIKVKKDTLFQDLNLKKVKDLLSLSPYALEVAFGKIGTEIISMAKGIDFSPVLPPKKEHALYEETYLKEDTNDLPKLRQVLSTLVESGLFKLRKQGLFCGKIEVSFRYIDYKFVSKEKKLKNPSQYSFEIGALVLSLFHDLFTRRTRIQFISVNFKELIQNEIQLSFLDHFQESKELESTMDSIKNKFGQHLIKFGKEVG